MAVEGQGLPRLLSPARSVLFGLGVVLEAALHVDAVTGVDTVARVPRALARDHPLDDASQRLRRQVRAVVEEQCVGSVLPRRHLQERVPRMLERYAQHACWCHIALTVFLLCVFSVLHRRFHGARLCIPKRRLSKSTSWK